MASGTLVRDSSKNRWSDSNKVYSRKIRHRPKTDQEPPPSSSHQTLATNSSQPHHPQVSTTDDSSNHAPRQLDVANNGHDVVAVDEENDNASVSRSDTNNNNSHVVVVNCVNDENMVSIDLMGTSKDEVRELRKRLLCELEQVRGLLNKLDAQQELNGFANNHSSPPLDNGPDVGLRQIEVVENNIGGLDEMETEQVDVVGGLRQMEADEVGNNGVFENGGSGRDGITNGGLRSPHGEGLCNVELVDNEGLRRMNNEVVDNSALRRVETEVYDNGGLRTMETEVYDNEGLRKMDTEVYDNGGLRRMGSGVFDNGGGRRMDTEVYENGGLRRTNSQVIHNGGVRRMDVEVYENGGLRRTNSQVLHNGGVRRMNGPLVSGGHRQRRPLHVAVLENCHGYGHGGVGDIVEKRTPKANQYYKSSEFIVGKERLPSESNKKSKNSKKTGGDGKFGVGASIRYSKIFQSCNSLLGKLQKHRWGWIFNKPVDVKGLGLHDYFHIIKHPMDLGTVKTRLSTYFYQSPREFADDVRLTFDNAMTYNPEGQDAHIMAAALSKLFEDDWEEMDNEYDLDSWFPAEHEEILHTPTARKAPHLHPHPRAHARVPQEMRSFERSDSMSQAVGSRPKPATSAPPVRTPAPKKPKAKDLNKRNMTFEEKQKLSANLTSLPAEKLDNIVQIIRKRNPTLTQDDDEIEVDIDSVDTETLWELDRFVTNYKKSLSKNKRKQELLEQTRKAAEQNLQERNIAPSMTGMSRETNAGESNVSPSPVQMEKQGDNASRSSSSSSSSSGSGSSSSDSDSDSSSGSDAGNSPRT